MRLFQIDTLADWTLCHEHSSSYTMLCCITKGLIIIIAHCTVYIKTCLEETSCINRVSQGCLLNTGSTVASSDETKPLITLWNNVGMTEKRSQVLSMTKNILALHTSVICSSHTQGSYPSILYTKQLVMITVSSLPQEHFAKHVEVPDQKFKIQL